MVSDALTKLNKLVRNSQLPTRTTSEKTRAANA